jgi:hypothetical protein
MAFDHRLLATDGLFPNLTSHFSIAVLGAFYVEIIIEPPKPKGPDYGYADLEYKITIRVRYNGKTWDQSRYVSYFTGKSLEKVVAVFRKGTTMLDRIAMKAKLINTSITKIFVRIK